MLSSIRSYLLKNANQKEEGSVSRKLRNERLKFFGKMCVNYRKPVRILDIGGSDYHWRQSGFENNKDYHITLVNIENQNLNGLNNFTFLKRDARDLGFFDDKEYSVVYSNSFIEHITVPEERKNIAQDIIRIGEHYFVQTPNYYFPIEPHFLFPFFQFLSEESKVKLLMRFNLGWFKRQENKEAARRLAGSVKLLRESELRELFPGSKIHKEKFYLLTKSYIAYN